jgi:hypothetical protein
MSTLRANSIEHTNGGPIAFTKQAALKMFSEVDQDSTGHPSVSSFNQSSTTDFATGQTTKAFTNNMSSADYAVAGSGQPQNESGGNYGVEGRAPTNEKHSTSSFSINCRIMNTNTNRDLMYAASMVAGDLA